METNEIMVNEDVIEVTEEIANAGFGKSFKVAAGVGLAVIVSFVAYKYVVKPMVAKIKTKKEQQRMDADFDEFEVVEVVEIDE